MMKRDMLLAAVLVLGLLSACGGEDPEEVAEGVVEGTGVTSVLDPLPDSPMFSMALVDPEAVVDALDGYTAGAPMLGSEFVSGWLLSLLDCADMDEVESKFGMDVSGGISVFVEGMTPQSFGGAVSVTDADVLMGLVGLQGTPGEPLDGREVMTYPVDFGSVLTCEADGLLLIAGSRAGLQSMLDRLDGRAPEGMPDVPEGSIYSYLQVSSFGPMAAAQLQAARPSIIQGMEMSSTQGDADMMRSAMDMYFEMIGLFLTETRMVESVTSFGPEGINISSRMDFVEGSSLAEYVLPAEVEDLSAILPAGDVAVGRFSMNPVTTEAALTAVLGSLGMDELPEEMVDLWTMIATNTAFSASSTPEEPMHILGVYAMPPEYTLEDVALSYERQFEMMGGLMDMPGLELLGPDIVEDHGRRWVRFGMYMDMAQLAEAEPGAGQMELEPVSWTAWMTVEEGFLFLEMAEEPATLLSMLDGTAGGETAADVMSSRGLSEDSEVALLLNLPGYMEMAMSMSGVTEFDAMELDCGPVWVSLEVDITEEGLMSHARVPGTEMVEFVSATVAYFSAARAGEEVPIETGAEAGTM